MINIIANIVGVAIVVGAIATVLDKRINALQGELHRHKRQTETELRSVEDELNYINSLRQDGNGMAVEAKTLANLAIGKIDETYKEMAFAIDKIEEIDRDLRGEFYAIEFWGGDCFGGFKKNGDPIDVSHSEARIMTRQEAERIKKMLGTGAIVNRSKTILKNLEDK